MIYSQVIENLFSNGSVEGISVLFIFFYMRILKKVLEEFLILIKRFFLLFSLLNVCFFLGISQIRTYFYACFYVCIVT